MKILKLTVLLTLIFGGAAKGIAQSKAQSEAQYTFDEVWTQVEKNSSSLHSIQSQLSAAELGQDRADRHWSPKLFVDLRTMSTNDPTMSFMSILSQRKVQASDFTPSTLNEPGTVTNQRSALVVDLPLYEGGAKKAQADMAHHYREVVVQDKEALRRELKTQVLKIYTSLVAIKTQRIQVEKLAQEISQFVSQYQLRKSENPVGYSGYLGLQNLKNKAEGTLISLKSQEQSLNLALQDLVGKDFVLVGEPAELDKKKVENELSNKGDNSPLVQASQLRVKIAQEQVRQERGNWLPQIGAFGEVYSFKGDRDTAQGSTVGLYLKWGLSGQTWGAVEQAQKSALAGQYQAEAIEQKVRIEKNQNEAQLAAIHENLKLVEASQQLMRDQVVSMRRLYQSGAVTGLQMAEVLNRQLELIQQKTDLEKQWSEVFTQILILSGQSLSGVQHATRS